MSWLSLGIDLGTSGIRTAVVRLDSGALVSSVKVHYAGPQGPSVDAERWWQTCLQCLEQQCQALKAIGEDPMTIRHAAIDGTSGTVLLVDSALRPMSPALMYHASGFEQAARAIAKHAPSGHITQGSNSALARVLSLQATVPADQAALIMHQADFILARLAGQWLGSDENNCLKLGYDPATGQWPEWLGQLLGNRCQLPKVASIGTPLGNLDPSVTTRLGLSPALCLHAGSTDSIAAFLACGASEQGDAVTSLGSTTVIKLLSNQRVDDASIGLYSHKLGKQWLVGGASNAGGATLAQYFSAAQIQTLSEQINPNEPSELDYYPLPAVGERFPVNDPTLAPRLSPVPEQPAAFLHGMLEGIARIEALGYQRLVEAGATAPKRLFSAGGGANNATWRRIRERHLKIPLLSATDQEAAIGMARLPGLSL